MQTFLPHPNYLKSAAVLDDKRLGKQRVEAWQIIQALKRGKGAWYNHPAVQMWKGFEWELCRYGMSMCAEWMRRGFRDTMWPRFKDYQLITEWRKDKMPWLGSRKFHSSHRSNLLRKKPEHYSKFGWRETPDKPYYWPTKN